MDIEKTATNACEIISNYSGSMQGLNYAQFREMMDRVYSLNQQIACGGLVVLSAQEHDELVKNQKVTRKKK